MSRNASTEGNVSRINGDALNCHRINYSCTDVNREACKYSKLTLTLNDTFTRRISIRKRVHDKLSFPRLVLVPLSRAVDCLLPGNPRCTEYAPASTSTSTSTVHLQPLLRRHHFHPPPLAADKLPTGTLWHTPPRFPTLCRLQPAPGTVYRLAPAPTKLCPDARALLLPLLLPLLLSRTFTNLSSSTSQLPLPLSCPSTPFARFLFSISPSLLVAFSGLSYPPLHRLLFLGFFVPSFSPFPSLTVDISAFRPCRVFSFLLLQKFHGWEPFPALRFFSNTCRSSFCFFLRFSCLVDRFVASLLPESGWRRYQV